MRPFDLGYSLTVTSGYNDASLFPSCSFTSFTSPGLVYLAGGASDTGIELRLMESYNPVIKEWTTLASMRTRRSQCAMAVLEDNLYVIGGYNSAKNVLSSVEKYSIAEVG